MFHPRRLAHFRGVRTKLRGDEGWSVSSLSLTKRGRTDMTSSVLALHKVSGIDGNYEPSNSSVESGSGRKALNGE